MKRTLTRRDALDRYIILAGLAVLSVIVPISCLDDARRSREQAAIESARDTERIEQNRQDAIKAAMIADAERKTDPYYDQRGRMPDIADDGLMAVASAWVRANTTDGSVVSATRPVKDDATWSQFAMIKARNLYGVFIIRRFEFRAQKCKLVHAGYDD